MCKTKTAVYSTVRTEKLSGGTEKNTKQCARVTLTRLNRCRSPSQGCNRWDGHPRVELVVNNRPRVETAQL